MLARFVSQYRKFKFGGIAQIEHETHSGARQIIQPSRVCVFQPGRLYPWERDEAIAHFQFKALGDDENPFFRLSVWDSEWGYLAGWTPEEVERVVAKLRDKQGQDFIEVVKPAARLPWPTYNAQTGEEVIATQEATGADPALVIAYEEENANRKGIINAMTAAQERDPEAVEVSA